MQPADGNLVLYHSGQALWASGAAGAGASVTMQSDGNLVVYNRGVAKWSSNTAGFSGALLALQDDSNLVIYQGSTAIWDWASGRLTRGGGGGSSQGQAIVNAASKWAGTQYCWDGGGINGPTRGTPDPTDGGYQCASGTVGFDCTGLTMYAV
jgi:cell wall-associated NlpC family hydrolase